MRLGFGRRWRRPGEMAGLVFVVGWDCYPAEEFSPVEGDVRLDATFVGRTATADDDEFLGDRWFGLLGGHGLVLRVVQKIVGLLEEIADMGEVAGVAPMGAFGLIEAAGVFAQVAGEVIEQVTDGLGVFVKLLFRGCGGHD